MWPVFHVGHRPTWERGVDLISDALRFGRLCYAGPNAVSNAIGYAQHRSRSHDAVIRVYDAAGNVIETHGARGRIQRMAKAAIRVGHPRILRSLSLRRENDFACHLYLI
jgi:hypothetical protein